MVDFEAEFSADFQFVKKKKNEVAFKGCDISI